MKKIFILLFFCILTGGMAFASAPKQELLLNRAEAALYQGVNSERRKRGLNELKLDERLVEIARLKSKDLCEGNYFSHESKSLGTPQKMLADLGFSHYALGGENLARGAYDTEKILKAWLASRGHRDNILNQQYDRTGIGAFQDEEGNLYCTQLFIDSY